MEYLSELEILHKREEELNFRRDLIEYSPESFTGEQIIELLREQRAMYELMEDCIRRDFQSRSPEIRAELLASLNGAGGITRDGWEGILS